MNIRELINKASFVVICGISFHIMTMVDENGYFFATDNDGGEREFHISNVDHVEAN